MTWKDRLLPNITLTSPEENIFVALWRGNDRTLEKKVGLFDFPLVNGTAGQDLGVRGTKYPLNIIFDGPDNDKEAERFWNACSESGRWKVEHPTKGILEEMQLLNVTEAVQPVTSGNVTEYNLDFIQLIREEVELTSAQLAALADSQAAAANEKSATQVDKNIKQDKASFIESAKNTVKDIQKSVNKILGPIFSTITEINRQVNSIQQGINTAMDLVLLTPLRLAGQIQALMQTPGLVLGSIQSRLDAYSKLTDEIFGMGSDKKTPDGKNVAAIQELALSAILVSTAQVVFINDLSRKEEAVSAIETISKIFNDVTNYLDSRQENFSANTVETQYFSQTDAFSELLLLLSQAQAFLLLSLFNLQTEKRFILKEGKSAIRVCIEEYGELGENDIFFEIFIATNQLKGNDIIYLKEGTEVVVYV